MVSYHAVVPLVDIYTIGCSLRTSFSVPSPLMASDFAV